MYRLNVKKEKQRYVLEELTKEFLRPGEYEVFVEEAVEDSGSGGSENGAGRKRSPMSSAGRKTRNVMRKSAAYSTNWRNLPDTVPNGRRGSDRRNWQMS